MKNKFLALAGVALLASMPVLSLAAPPLNNGCDNPGKNPNCVASVPEIDGALGLQILVLCAGLGALIKRKK